MPSPWARRLASEASGPCHAYVGSGETIHHRDGSIGIEAQRPCRRRASGFGAANTPACWQHRLPLKRWNPEEEVHR